ncbi:LLM class F420-dependent oxidoreductase [Intrasporangium sp. DVR]|uniref:LLM class F420-dependent oxidoreductase n=1 Tax=Intrasporangium sp. DVR TaxID=3127867 RepID=UPI00313A51CB
MRLGVNLGYWDRATAAHDMVAIAKEADRLGYDSLWVAEAYGSDAPSMLAWIGALTERIHLGSAVMQIPARTPAMTGMTAATIDTMSGGRFRLGLGVSGPQVSEGWHGVRFTSPLGRTRDYVDIVRAVLRRERVTHPGPHYELPLPDGPGKALKLGSRPLRSEVPVYLAAVGPRNLALTGEIADGWLAIFLSPAHAREEIRTIAEARRAAGRGTPTDPMAGFDVVSSTPVVLVEDVRAAADHLRDYCALYIGGMGSREQNFYNRLACRMGFEEEAARIQDLYLAGQHREAAAAVPIEFIDETALLGSPQRVAQRLRRYEEAGVTTLAVATGGRMTRDQATATLAVVAQLHGVREG